MYSRYPNYQPFDPLQNMLSRSLDGGMEPGAETEPAFVPETAAPVSEPLAELANNSDLLGSLGALSSLLGGGKGSPLGGLLGGGKGGIGSLLGGSGKSISGLLNGGLGGLLKNFSINWDAGDILLVLILLFLSIESDDEEILMLLGLMLFLGL